MNIQHKYIINLIFLHLKGVKNTLTGLNKALTWIKTTNADCLVHGE